MVTFEQISLDDLEAFIRIAFYGDDDLVEKYHVVNGNFDECVKDTFRRICEVAKKNELIFYSVWHGWIPVGFTVTGKSFLLSFGINIKSRTREIVTSCWKKVCMLLDNEFVTWIFKKNTRTVEFLRRNGMEIVEDGPEKEFYNLIYILCPQE